MSFLKDFDILRLGLITAMLFSLLIASVLSLTLVFHPELVDALGFNTSRMRLLIWISAALAVVAGFFVHKTRPK